MFRKNSKSPDKLKHLLLKDFNYGVEDAVDEAVAANSVTSAIFNCKVVY